VTSERKTLLIAGCDAQVLIWALPWSMRPEGKKKKPVQQHVLDMRVRARILLRLLEEEGFDLCIPSVVVAELLAGVEPQKHARLLAEFDERFFCPPFDSKACALAARLWQFERGLPGTSAGLPEAERTERIILKSDMLIVASAKAAGATRFYSHDKKCLRLAKEAGMDARDLPVTSGNFVTDQEAKEAEAMDRGA
jgi:predicted nucleic acid-binding protein